MAASRKKSGRRFGFSRRAKAAAGRAPNVCHLGFEALEDRRLLSTINWTNQGSGPANDTDGFDATFGPNAAQARLIVTRAIFDWEEVIVNFNHSGGGNTYSLSISMGELGDSLRAQGGATARDVDLVPTTGSITLDLDAGGSGWYIDPVIGDDGEFDTILGPFSATGTITGNDLYRTITHEIGHAVGITQNTFLRLSQFLTNLMVDDPVADDGTDPGGLWAFNVNGGLSEATFTAADSGHFFEGPAIANRPDIPIHPNDLMNPGRAATDNNRKLISDLGATVLRDAYGYSVTMPSTLNNFLVNPNFTTDVLTISGYPGTENDVVVVSSAPGGFNVVVSGFSEIVPLSQTDSIVINTGDGTDQVHLTYNATKPTTVNGGAGISDTLFLTGGATVNDDTVTGSTINTVTYTNFDALTLTGTNGDDVFNVKSTNSFANVTINGGLGNDSLFINPDLGALSHYGLPPITWNGGDDIDKLQFDMQSTGFSDQYTVTGSVVEVDRLNGFGGVIVNQVGFSYFSDSVVVNAGSGNDEIFLPESNLKGTFNGGVGNDLFFVGGGNVGTSYTSATLSGGTGNDTLVLDDSLYAGAANWVINDVNVQRNIPGFAQLFSYAGFEGIGIKTGAGGSTANNITTFGAIPVSLAVTGGAGRDHFFINNFANEAAGGPAGPEQLQSLFDGGGGFNQLIVDDSARGILTYNMYPTRLEINEVLADDGEFSFLGIHAMSITASDSLTTFNLYGTPTTIDSGNQTTVFLRGGNDVANVFPHDAAGNLTITTNVGIVGEGGTDTLNIQDAASANAINYLIFNPFGAGTQSIYGLGGGGFGTATVENLVVNAGTGADTFDVNQFTSGAGLTVNAGGGDDTLNIGNGSLAANITSIAAFAFNGQVGFDRFNVNNTIDIGLWTYTRNIASIQAIRAGYVGLFLSESAIEEMTVNAGSGGDKFLASGNSTGTHTIFNGAGGQDTLQAGTVGGLTSTVLGPITFDAGTPSALHGGTVNVSSAAHGDAKTAHMTVSTLGAHPDDNLFGAGGSLTFSNITSMNLTLGSGLDTVYALPLTDATVQIMGSTPTTLPGDTLNLDLASAVNYVITPTSASAGNVTSENLQTLTYSGFESGPNIDDVPDVPIFIVDTLVDENDGDYSAGDLSLREAIRFANFTSEIDSIAFSAELSGGTIVLTLGELRITRSVPIIGLGAQLLTIDASGNDPTPTVNNGDGSRVFNIDDGNLFANIDVEIVGLTLTGGDVTGSGGGILTREDLSITASTIRGNSATFGGGFHSLGGNLTLASSTISGNSAINGGGIYSQSSSLMVTNSTISGNAANSSGGGILILYGGVLLTHSTITGNVADADVSNSGFGGGIAMFDNPYYPSVNLELDHVIVAGNLRGASTRSDIFGQIINGTRFSLIGDRTGVSNIINNGGNLIGTSSSPIDPELDPLADNGGPTMTHALLVGSPAIDAGDMGFSGPPDNDQRGTPFVRVFDGDSAGGALIDIGSFELQTLPSSADFDEDGDVDGRDFLAWQRGGSPDPLSASDLAVWQLQYDAAAPLAGLPAVSSQISALEVATLQGVPSVLGSQLLLSNSELIDLAVAMEWLGSVQVTDERWADDQETWDQTDNELMFSRNTLIPRVVAFEDGDFEFNNSEDECEGKLAWLSDELLERVFG